MAEQNTSLLDSLKSASLLDKFDLGSRRGLAVLDFLTRRRSLTGASTESPVSCSHAQGLHGDGKVVVVTLGRDKELFFQYWEKRVFTCFPKPLHRASCLAPCAVSVYPDLKTPGRSCVVDNAAEARLKFSVTQCVS